MRSGGHLERDRDYWQPTRGNVGTVRYDLSALGSDARETVWALARFAELRGIGKHTTYGMGRVRLRA